MTDIIKMVESLQQELKELREVVEKIIEREKIRERIKWNGIRQLIYEKALFEKWCVIARFDKRKLWTEFSLHGAYFPLLSELSFEQFQELIELIKEKKRLKEFQYDE